MAFNVGGWICAVDADTGTEQPNSSRAVASIVLAILPAVAILTLAFTLKPYSGGAVLWSVFGSWFYYSGCYWLAGYGNWFECLLIALSTSTSIAAESFEANARLDYGRLFITSTFRSASRIVLTFHLLVLGAIVLVFVADFADVQNKNALILQRTNEIANRYNLYVW